MVGIWMWMVGSGFDWVVGSVVGFGLVGRLFVYFG